MPAISPLVLFAPKGTLPFGVLPQGSACEHHCLCSSSHIITCFLQLTTEMTYLSTFQISGRLVHWYRSFVQLQQNEIVKHKQQNETVKHKQQN